MILNALAEQLKRRAKDDFKGRHYEATLILQAVSWYLRYPLSYRDRWESSLPIQPSGNCCSQTRRGLASHCLA